jgi:SNF2 family DNA or RNA helicase
MSASTNSRPFQGGDGTEDEPFNPEHVIIDRIIAERQKRGNREFLVKWRGLEYGRSTWEREEDLENDQDAIERYELADKKPRPDPKDRKEPEDLVFKTGRTLRDYQLVGVKWLDQNFRRRKSCMLGDEMGLGKTFQVRLFGMQQWLVQGLRRGKCVVG